MAILFWQKPLRRNYSNIGSHQRCQEGEGETTFNAVICRNAVSARLNIKSHDSLGASLSLLDNGGNGYSKKPNHPTEECRRGSASNPLHGLRVKIRVLSYHFSPRTTDFFEIN